MGTTRKSERGSSFANCLHIHCSFSGLRYPFSKPIVAFRYCFSIFSSKIPSPLFIHFLIVKVKKKCRSGDSKLALKHSSSTDLLNSVDASPSINKQ